MPSTGQGRRALVGGAEVFDEDLMPYPDVPFSPLVVALNDYFWGSGSTGPPAVVQIPYAWLSYPLVSQPTPAFTKAIVTQSNGVTASSTAAPATVRRYGAGIFTATLDTLVDADTRNLANMVTTYQSTPRPRRPVLRLNLIARTDAECLRIRRVGIGSRVHITDAPAAWPAGGADFTVQGIRHTITVDERLIDWTTIALIGAVAGTPGPWFRWGASSWGGTDVKPF